MLNETSEVVQMTKCPSAHAFGWLAFPQATHLAECVCAIGTFLLDDPLHVQHAWNSQIDHGGRAREIGALVFLLMLLGVKKGVLEGFFQFSPPPLHEVWQWQKEVGMFRK